MPTEERERVQGALAAINAQIKALNTTEAARLKAAADRRKAVGLAEAQANADRARVKIGGTPEPEDAPEDDDPGQTSAIDGWIDAVLLRHDVTFTRARDGKLTIHDAPCAPVLGMLVDGIYATARGQELPDLPILPKKAPKKTKK